MPSCYILYSSSIDSFYVGATTFSVKERIAKHNSRYYSQKWSTRGIPWSLYLEIPCQSMSHAIAIEAHIKRMKSKVYIQNLKSYPEMIDRLISKYSKLDC